MQRAEQIAQVVRLKRRQVHAFGPNEPAGSRPVPAVPSSESQLNQPGPSETPPPRVDGRHAPARPMADSRRRARAPRSSRRPRCRARSRHDPTGIRTLAGDARAQGLNGGRRRHHQRVAPTQRTSGAGHQRQRAQKAAAAGFAPAVHARSELGLVRARARRQCDDATSARHQPARERPRPPVHRRVGARRR